MRVIVTKPVDGRTNIRCDDRRGLTGRVWKQRNVSVTEVGQVVAPMLAAWERRRELLEEAKRQAPA